MKDNIVLAGELVRIAGELLKSSILPGKRLTALEFRNRKELEEYKKKHRIRKTTTVVVDKEIVSRGKDRLQINKRDVSGLLNREKDRSFRTREDGRKIPQYERIRVSHVPWYVHDGISNMPKRKQEYWKEKCKEDVERLNPGLWRKAQKVYDGLDDIEKDVLRAYTLRDLYDINKQFLRIYKDIDRDMSQIQMWETQRRLRLLKKLPKFKGNLWRGMNFETKEKLDEFVAKWQEEKFPLTGFVSTTYIEDNASLYFDERKLHCVIRIVNSKNGRYVGHLSSTPRDEEVLYSCNQRFRLVGEGETEFLPVEDKEGVKYITVVEDGEL